MYIYTYIYIFTSKSKKTMIQNANLCSRTTWANKIKYGRRCFYTSYINLHVAIHTCTLIHRHTHTRLKQKPRAKHIQKQLCRNHKIIFVSENDMS